MMKTKIIAALFGFVVIGPTAHAQTDNLQLGKELHRSLLLQEKESFSNVLADALIRSRPEYESHRDVIVSFLDELSESEEFEKIRSTYFARTLSEQELRVLIKLATSEEFRLYQRATTGLAEHSTQQLMSMVARRAQELSQRITEAERLAKSNRDAPANIDDFSFRTRDWIEERIRDIEARVRVQLIAARTFSVRYAFNMPLSSVDGVRVLDFNSCLARYLSAKKGRTHWVAGFSKTATMGNDSRVTDFFIVVLNDGERQEQASAAGDVTWMDPVPNDHRMTDGCDTNLRPEFRVTQGK